MHMLWMVLLIVAIYFGAKIIVNNISGTTVAA
jgi:hypothetical protein